MIGYNEKEQPETATRNMSSFLKVVTAWPAHFSCPTGDVAPLMALEVDNGKLSKLFFWLCGVLFLALDLTVLVIVSNAAIRFGRRIWPRANLAARVFAASYLRQTRTRLLLRKR